MSDGIKKIKGYRVMLGLTQEEMAKKLGVTLRTYFDKENGIRPFTIDELIKIKDLCNKNAITVSLDDLT